jgi:hypothetical protein
VKALLFLFVVACSSSDAPPPRERTPRDAGRVATRLPDPKPEPSGDLPAECGLYKALVGRMARCEHLGPQRGLLERQFETSWKAWAALPQTERTGVAASCRAAADAVRAAIVYCGP